MRPLRITEDKIWNWLEEESGALDNKDLYTECPKTGGDHSVEGSDGKESACIAGNLGSILGLGRSPGKGNGNPLLHSCLENFIDTGAWPATIHATPWLGVKTLNTQSPLALGGHDWATNTLPWLNKWILHVTRIPNISLKKRFCGSSNKIKTIEKKEWGRWLSKNNIIFLPDRNVELTVTLSCDM